MSRRIRAPKNYLMLPSEIPTDIDPPSGWITTLSTNHAGFTRATQTLEAMPKYLATQNYPHEVRAASPKMSRIDYSESHIIGVGVTLFLALPKPKRSGELGQFANFLVRLFHGHPHATELEPDYEI